MNNLDAICAKRITRDQQSCLLCNLFLNIGVEVKKIRSNEKLAILLYRRHWNGGA